jgi:hypothetical protein
MTMTVDDIQSRVRRNEYLYSLHADIERQADQLKFAQIEEALLNCTLLEHYEDTGRGESCLVVGFAGDVPIHIICGWRASKIVIITVYIPRHPDFVDPWTRGENSHER